MPFSHRGLQSEMLFSKSQSVGAEPKPAARNATGVVAGTLAVALVIGLAVLLIAGRISPSTSAGVASPSATPPALAYSCDGDTFAPSLFSEL
jgi:hypothetical protein